MKKAVLTALQVVATLTALFFVFGNAKTRSQMAAAMSKADWTWLVTGLAAYGIVEVIAGVRWQLLLRVQGISLSWVRLTALMLVGLFFNFFIPGGTGGDMVKIFYLLKETPGKRPAALLSVLVDRLFGLVALALFGVGLALVRWDWLMRPPETARYVWLALGLLVASLGGLHFTYIVSKHGWVHRLPAKFPMRDKLAEFALAYGLYGKAWRTSLAAFGLSIAAHFAYFTLFYCAGQAYFSAGTRTPSFYDLFTILPLVNTIVSLPISLGGIGVREGMFQIFLSNLCPGVTAGVAVLISSTGYLLTLTWGMIGGIVYLFYRPSEHARLRTIKEEVAAFEHEVAEEEIAAEVAAKSPLP